MSWGKTMYRITLAAVAALAFLACASQGRITNHLDHGVQLGIHRIDSLEAGSDNLLRRHVTPANRIRHGPDRREVDRIFQRGGISR